MVNPEEPKGKNPEPNKEPQDLRQIKLGEQFVIFPSTQLDQWSQISSCFALTFPTDTLRQFAGKVEENIEWDSLPIELTIKCNAFAFPLTHGVSAGYVTTTGNFQETGYIIDQDDYPKHGEHIEAASLRRRAKMGGLEGTLIHPNFTLAIELDPERLAEAGLLAKVVPDSMSYRATPLGRVFFNAIAATLSITEADENQNVQYWSSKFLSPISAETNISLPYLKYFFPSDFGALSPVPDGSHIYQGVALAYSGKIEDLASITGRMLFVPLMQV